MRSYATTAAPNGRLRGDWEGRRCSTFCGDRPAATHCLLGDRAAAGTTSVSRPTYSLRVAVQPDPRSYERYKAENGWVDVIVDTIGPYELVQQPALNDVWYLIDTRRPLTRENRHRVNRQNHDGWVVDGEQPGAWFFGLHQMREAIDSWIALQP